MKVSFSFSTTGQVNLVDVMLLPLSPSPPQKDKKFLFLFLFSEIFYGNYL